MRLSMDDLSGKGLACGGNIQCERSVVGTQVTCVRVYENGTYMCGGVPVCLYVVAVSTPRLVRTLCALRCGFFMSMHRFNSYLV